MSELERTIHNYVKEHPTTTWEDLVRDLDLPVVVAQWAII